MFADDTRVQISDEILSQLVKEYTAEEAAAVIRAINGTPEPVQEIIKVSTSWADTARSVLTTLIWGAAIVCIIYLSRSAPPIP